MTKYVLKRLLYMVIVFLLVSLLMYSIYNLIPTDPARAQLEPMKTTLKPEEYEQRYQMLRQQMGLNDPLIVRSLRWIGAETFFIGSVLRHPARRQGRSRRPNGG